MTLTWVIVLAQFVLQGIVLLVFFRRCDDYMREITWEFPAAMGAVLGLGFLSLGLQWLV